MRTWDLPASQASGRPDHTANNTQAAKRNNRGFVGGIVTSNRKLTVGAALHALHRKIVLPSKHVDSVVPKSSITKVDQQEIRIVNCRRHRIADGFDEQEGARIS